MYCVGLQLVRQCNPQRKFPFAEGAGEACTQFLRSKYPKVPFCNRAKNLENLGLLALFFALFFKDNIVGDKL
jgi:hypothetical protein